MVTAIWIAFAALHLFSSYLDTMKYRGDYVFNLAEVAAYLLAYHGWALFSLGFFNVVEKYSQRLSFKILILLWFVTALLWLPLFLSWDAWLTATLIAPPNQSWLTILSNVPNAIILLYFILYCVTTAASIAVFYYRSSQQALIEALTLEKKHADSELMLAEMQLEHLQSRLSPHFLFNCLSSISALARNENKDALISAVAQMGNLLRFCVSDSIERFIPLAQELKFVDDYVALQTLRYPDLFRFNKEIVGRIQGALCPPFLLQPLIENTFTHGVDVSQALTQIQLRITMTDNSMLVTVSNSKSLTTEQNIGLSSALKNFKERLQILYPSQHQVSLDNAATHFTVSLIIPIITEEDIDID